MDGEDGGGGGGVAGRQAGSVGVDTKGEILE